MWKNTKTYFMKKPVNRFVRIGVRSNSMKVIAKLVLLIAMWNNSYGQDGSDITYFKVIGVDNTLIAQDVQFDFYNRSFGGWVIDTVTIRIDGKPIQFVEVRKDNGYNNWFSQQYLQSTGKVNEQTIRISKFKLDGISKTSFQVTMFIDYYDNKNILQAGKSRQEQYTFDTKMITEVLVESTQ